MSRNFVDRKRRFSDVQQDKYSDIYAGPDDFVEAGTRGFLISSLPDKEEFAIDDAMYLLRQAAIKLKGGINAGRKLKQDSWQTYVKINFTDFSNIEVLPNPDGAEEPEEKDTDTIESKKEER